MEYDAMSSTPSPVLEYRVIELVKELDREHRPAVIGAWESCDGTLLSFMEEMTAQTWDYPELPVQSIVDQIAYDVV